jgi:hypothetical protein
MNLDRLRRFYSEQRSLLDNAIANHNQRLITLYRGRLITTLNRLLSIGNYENLSRDEQRFFNSELRIELENHRIQLNYRIEHEKRSNRRFSISTDIGLKIRRTSNSFNQVFTAITGDERIRAGVNTAVNTLSTIFSMSKFVIRPAGFVVQRVGGGVAFLTGYAVGLPVGVVANLFGSIVNPDRRWTFNISRRFGGSFRDFTEDAIGALNDTIIRL